MKRRRWSIDDKMLVQERQGYLCALCGLDFSGFPIEYDHALALSLGGTDTLDNLRAVHAKCHDKKTNGPGGEKRVTSAGSDAHARAKHRRLTGKNKPKVKRDWPSRPLESRGFEKRRPIPERINRNGEPR